MRKLQFQPVLRHDVHPVHAANRARREVRYLAGGKVAEIGGIRAYRTEIEAEILRGKPAVESSEPDHPWRSIVEMVKHECPLQKRHSDIAGVIHIEEILLDIIGRILRRVEMHCHPARSDFFEGEFRGDRSDIRTLGPEPHGRRIEHIFEMTVTETEEFSPVAIRQDSGAGNQYPAVYLAAVERLFTGEGGYLHRRTLSRADSESARQAGLRGEAELAAEDRKSTR